MNQRIYLSPPHMSGHEMKYIQEAFDTNWIAPLGPNVDAFEQELCNYVDIKYGLALSSGTAGIHLVLRYLGVMPGDYVFCSSLTFSGSCNPIMYQYANPVFIDSEPDSWNMSPEALERAFDWANKENKMPKAVIIVDLYGQSADYEKLLPICEYYGVPVIEDAAEALGATYKGRKCGNFGYAGIFSFNGNKIITTSGGGMVVSNDEGAIKKMRFWSTQAKEPVRHYEHKEFGYNYRMSNVCAGIGRGQLMALDKRIAMKKKIYQRYVNDLNSLPVTFMPVQPNNEPNYWLTVMTINEDCKVSPEDIMIALEEENIESRPVWKPMHLQPVFKDYPFFSHLENKSIAEKIFERGLCLPSGSSMSSSEQSKVIEIINIVFSDCR
ncbi:DegT/DnrJ/EryC1/StrS family aminotransferase [Desulfotruncus alcoholivorax]|uniref:DegT/DnrJ/EryC1/StrS family aminotransferase n=1 Tax=Desulfotruncus alcoholivorax TaxID=265477 RepID=UPI000485F3FE|nr:DegT/DnrJ/EryC1/StrS family aminotransferase [Desulfotruncus alcoholivorax]